MPIPFISTPDKAISDTTQDLIPVADIVDDIVIYRHGGAALIMESTSLNFGLFIPLNPDYFMSIPSLHEVMVRVVPWGKVIGSARCLFSVGAVILTWKIFRDEFGPWFIGVRKEAP